MRARILNVSHTARHVITRDHEDYFNDEMGSAGDIISVEPAIYPGWYVGNGYTYHESWIEIISDKETAMTFQEIEKTWRATGVQVCCDHCGAVMKERLAEISGGAIMFVRNCRCNTLEGLSNKEVRNQLHCSLHKMLKGEECEACRSCKAVDVCISIKPKSVDCAMLRSKHGLRRIGE